MEDVLSISTQKPADIAFDYEELRKAGVRHIETIASGIWTDYNIHDPGITSLELLCFAVTDLAYRSSYVIPDLMRKPGDSPAEVVAEFHTAKNIFPNKALTINDYRKLLINEEGIKNAWLVKKTLPVFADLIARKLTHTEPTGHHSKLVQVKGYYDVLLEFDTNVKSAGARKEKIDAVRKLLHNNRNLDEDFPEIKQVDQQAFRLCSEIELDTAADPLETLAQIFFSIQLHLAPLVRFYSLQQMLNDVNKKYTTDEIFEGPFISHGFIKEDELLNSELKKELHLSDIMQIILNTKGVISIPEILFNDIHQTEELPLKWIIPVKPGHQPVIDILTSNVVLYKNGVPFRPGAAAKASILNRFTELMDNYLAANEAVKAEDIRFNTGAFRNTSDYYSVQNHYPKNYGISHWGLPEDSTAERKKQAKQLQAYLWFFDQVLANYLAQLSSVKNIFSLADEKNTRFTQLADSFKNADKLFVNNKVVTAQNIQAPAENNETFLLRRNKFLDHLLSRFAESFYDYVNILNTLFPYTDPNSVIKIKRKFLQDYPVYSCQRAAAYNYTGETGLWDSDNISGFEKRVKSLLGIDNINRRSLVNMFSVIKEETDAAVKRFWFEIIDNRSGISLLVQAKKEEVTILPPDKATEQKVAEEAAKDKVRDEIKIAYALSETQTALNVIKDTDGKFLCELRDKHNELIATGPKGTKKNAEEKMQLLLKYLHERSEEGMFLVEHLLLFSPEATEMLPICVDPNCDECSDTDPYSFRISIVVPACAARFTNIDFRNYVEKVMREEMPAHLMMKVCWVDNEQLKEFEDACQQWLLVKAGKQDDPDGKILAAFIQVLTHLKSIYPEACLMDCDSGKEKKLFMLDKNSLGTQKN